MLSRAPRRGDRIGATRAIATVTGLEGPLVLVRYDGAPEGGPGVMLWQWADGTWNEHLTIWE